MAQSARRQSLIRLIHVAKRDLQMAEDTYRDLLQSIGNASSSSELSDSKLEKVLEHMKRAGFKVRSKRAAAPEKRPSRPLAADPESKKIRALWLFLHQLGAVKNPSEAALAAYVKRIAGIDALQWASSAQAERIIETMKKWAMRFLPAAVEQLARKVAEATNSGALQLDELTVGRLSSCIHTAQSRGTYDPMLAAWEMLTEVNQKGEEVRHG